MRAGSCATSSRSNGAFRRNTDPASNGGGCNHQTHMHRFLDCCQHQKQGASLHSTHKSIAGCTCKRGRDSLQPQASRLKRQGLCC